MIDAHMHAFPERLMSAIYKWFQNNREWDIPYHGWNADRLFDYQNEQGYDRYFVLLYVHKSGMAKDLNDWLAAMVKQTPKIVPVGCVHHEDDVEGETERCLGDLGFAGMKLHCAVQNITMDDKRLDPLYKTLIRYNRPLVVHAGTAPVDYTGKVGFAYFARTMDRFPELRVQVAHLGLYESEQFFQLAEQLPGVVFDTAAINPASLEESVSQEQLKDWITRYSDRILFGSDLPFLNGWATDVRSLIDGLNLEDAVLQKVYAENARQFWNM
ncbi:amidohydrolase family protein [Effusibacillus dendaii]|uniref:Amidohydrolase n=1 Tax=Effusibacillus dendaii TaxID=2743772 RepID=A0A7I8DCU9_9BACL|nr:amidohydrolase family protein [Effusibacillus dendaii]BCJ88008.1 amidohydrolase [Effusibacillus dendaii]